MRVPEDIAEKVKEYARIKVQYEELEREITQWLEKNTPANSCCWIGNFMTVTKEMLCGTAAGLGEGEYCDQSCQGEDWYTGTYYIPIENSDEYISYDYES